MDVKLLTTSSVVTLSATDRRLVAALTWLRLVDDGEYENSWHETGKLFQSHISCMDWSEKLRVVREPFGNNISRKINSCTGHEALPGVPDGAYAVQKFDSMFVQKYNSLEKITLEKSEKGWRVVGYFIE